MSRYSVHFIIERHGIRYAGIEYVDALDETSAAIAATEIVRGYAVPVTVEDAKVYPYVEHDPDDWDFLDE